MNRATTAAGVLGAAVLVAATTIAGAGPLDPPAGPVAPTYKTLTEVEPRTAINAANTPGDADALFKITQPGSYYLTGNITGAAGLHGIEIAAQDVTLDLMGFSVQGVGGSLSGVFMASFRENVAIRNGHIRDWDQSGIHARIDIGRIERITASENGGWGIDNGAFGTFTTHIVSCEVFNNGQVTAETGGIRGGARSHITDCLAYSNSGDGIAADIQSIVARCIVRANTDDGIAVGSGCRVMDCLSAANTGDGIECANDGHVTGNTCGSNGEAGLHATGSDNRIEGNTCTDSLRGFDVDAAGNLIIRNSASGNTTNYDLVAGNMVGTIVTTEVALNAAANGNVNMSF